MLLEISLQHGLRLGRHLLDRPAEPAGIRTHRAPERLRARLPAVCDLWEWVDVGTHGVRERHERRRVPDASPLTTEVLQRLSACPPTHAPHSQSTIRPSGPDGSTYVPRRLFHCKARVRVLVVGRGLGVLWQLDQRKKRLATGSQAS